MMMNIIDKFISIFSPEKTLKRVVARNTLNTINNFGYSRHGASTQKKSLVGWMSGSASPDEDIVDNIPILRERSRDLYMGTPLATGAIKTIVTNVVGAGLQLNAQIDAEFLGMSEEEAMEWEETTEREFKLWSRDCDVQRMSTFSDLQELAFLSMLMCGDSFALMPLMRNNSVYSLKVQLIEADRVCNPHLFQGIRRHIIDGVERKIIEGVERGDFGELTAYHIAKYHPGSIDAVKNEWIRVDAFGKDTGRRNVLHLMIPERIGQARGVPVLSPVIESLKQLGRYTDAELMAAVVSGMYTVFIKSETPESPHGSNIHYGDQVDTQDENTIELGSGAIVGLGPNESIQEANPGRPNQAFDGFVSAVCRQIAGALELPFELLIKHFTSSYSASRAALLEAWKMFKKRRTWLINHFCQPIYEEFLTEAVARGRIYAPGFLSDPLVRQAYSQAEWYGPSQGQLDPLKEVKAAKERVQEGFSTRARETAELTGENFEVIHKTRVREEQMRKTGGLICVEKPNEEMGGEILGEE